jgi:hypothetical protein
MRLSVFEPPSAGIDMKLSSETRGPLVAAMRRLCARRAFRRRFARDAFVRDDHQRVAGARNVGQPHDLDRNRGPGLLHLLALVVDERADLAVRAAHDDDVADAQRAVLHEHGRDRAAALIERRFDDDALRAALLVGFEVAQVGFEQHRFEELIDAFARARGDRNHFGFAAPIDRLQTLLRRAATSRDRVARLPCPSC